MISKKGNEFSVAGGMWSTIQQTSRQSVDHSRFVGRWSTHNHRPTKSTYLLK